MVPGYVLYGPHLGSRQDMAGVFARRRDVGVPGGADCEGIEGTVAGVCADLLLMDQRNSVWVINGGCGGVGDVGR